MRNRQLLIYATVTILLVALAAASGNRSVPLSRVLQWITSGPNVNSGQHGPIAAPENGSQAQGNGGSFTKIEVSTAGTTALEGTIAWSINASGEVAGAYITTGNVTHGFLRSATGTITTFDAPDAGTGTNEGTFPLGIDGAGNITGMYADINNVYHGFVLPAGGSITEFDAPGAAGAGGHRGTIPISISAGVITGSYLGGTYQTTSVYHGFLRAADGTITSFDAPGAGTGNKQGTQPISINAAGVITGGYTDANFLYHAFIRHADGTFTAPVDAPNSGGLGTIGTSIDSAGDIVGVYTGATGLFHGFVLPEGGILNAPIDAPGAASSGGSGKGLSKIQGTLAAAINSAAGLTAGVYTDSSGVAHCFLLPTGGAITAPVDAPGAGSASLQGTACFSANDSGIIAGTYADSNEVLHGFILTPTISPPQAATPTFSPPAGTYTSAQNVTILDSTTNATIYYTTDDSTPTTASPVYSSSIPVNSTETIKAIAVADGYSNSLVGSAAYQINTAETYTLSVSPSSLSIVAGQSGQATFTVTPQNGFSSQVTFACSGLPAEATCTFNPTSVTPTGGNAATTTLTIATTAPKAAMQEPETSRPRLFYAMVAPGVAIFFVSVLRKKKGLWALQVLGIVTVLFLAAALLSCSSSSNSKTGGTPAGTSTVSVTASSSANGGVSQTASLKITITQ